MNLSLYSYHSLRCPLFHYNIQWIWKRQSRLQLRVRNKNLFFLFLNQNICCGYSKEPSQWDGSFELPKHILKLMDKKIFTFLSWIFLLFTRLFYSLCFISVHYTGQILSTCYEVWAVDVCRRFVIYSKNSVKRPLSKRPIIDVQDRLSLNAGQKHCRMLICSTFDLF